MSHAADAGHNAARTTPLCVSQVGPYPPPYGGVGVHIQRLRQHLAQAGCDVVVWCQPNWAGNENGIMRLPQRGRPACYFEWLLEARRKLPGEIVHFHDLRGYAFWAWVSLRRGRSVVVTVHEQFMLAHAGFLCGLSRWATKRARSQPRCRFIAVNPFIAQQVLALGVPRERVAVIPAFLPPPNPAPVEALDPAIIAFAQRHRPLLAVYGISCAVIPVFGDLYGFALCLEALARLRRTHPGAGLIVLTPANQDQPYFHQLLAQARALGVEEGVLWWTTAMPDASPLWALADVYVRPTTTDGDALAVREALAAGTPVVASDAAPRPGGTILFPSRDLAAFGRAIASALSAGRHRPTEPSAEGFRAVLRVYAGLSPQIADRFRDVEARPA